MRPLALAIVVFGAVICKADVISFSNTTTIEIPGFGVADPYPSAINVAGVTGSITNITIALNGVSHSFPDDIAAVVVAPSGTATLLFSGPGGFLPANSLDWVFDDNADNRLPSFGPLTSGTFRPGQNQYGDGFPRPGPGINYGRNFRRWLNENPNGRWRLFAGDAEFGDSGEIEGGWSISFHTTTAVPEPSSAALLALMTLGFARRRNRQ